MLTYVRLAMRKQARGFPSFVIIHRTESRSILLNFDYNNVRICRISEVQYRETYVNRRIISRNSKSIYFYARIRVQRARISRN